MIPDTVSWDWWRLANYSSRFVSVPAKRPIKPVYVKKFVALVDAVREVRSHESK
jgi:hypothetical protein